LFKSWSRGPESIIPGQNTGNPAGLTGRLRHRDGCGLNVESRALARPLNSDSARLHPSPSMSIRDPEASLSTVPVTVHCDSEYARPSHHDAWQLSAIDSEIRAAIGAGPPTARPTLPVSLGGHRGRDHPLNRRRTWKGLCLAAEVPGRVRRILAGPQAARRVWARYSLSRSR
jgi:hypothetical protein